MAETRPMTVDQMIEFLMEQDPRAKVVFLIGNTPVPITDAEEGVVTDSDPNGTVYLKP